MTLPVFRHLTSCSLVDTYRRFVSIYLTTIGVKSQNIDTATLEVIETVLLNFQMLWDVSLCRSASSYGRFGGLLDEQNMRLWKRQETPDIT